MSKGSGRRPRQIDRGTFESNWDSVFKKKAEKEFIRFRCAACNSSYVDEDTSKPCTVCGGTEFTVHE